MASYVRTHRNFSFHLDSHSTFEIVAMAMAEAILRDLLDHFVIAKCNYVRMCPVLIHTVTTCVCEQYPCFLGIRQSSRLTALLLTRFVTRLTCQ